MTARTIYIIDDDQAMVDLLAEYVLEIGCQVKTYTKAVVFFKENNSFAEGSIILLDLNMPEMDGIEVMRQMVKTGKSLPLILMSGFDPGVLHSAEQLAKAHSLSIIACLPKPFNFGEFKKIIQAHTMVKSGPGSRPELSINVLEIKQAIEQNQLVLHYQPQVDIKSRSLTGVEVLVRWQHPQYGLIYPDSFISLAEDNGLIEALTEQVIQQAVSQASSWKSEKLELQMSVNISAENIASLTLPEQLSRVLMEYQIDPTMLTLEVTESALMGHVATSLDILTRLRIKGIELSIDDFGTGYSSLSQLYRIPFTELKVDKSFVANIAHDPEALGIVKTCIMLGHELKMQVVAEGVEDKETLEILKEIDCDIAQGYHIARPMPAEDIIPWSIHHGYKF